MSQKNRDEHKPSPFYIYLFNFIFSGSTITRFISLQVFDTLKE